jgi:spore germination protein GerM
VKLWRARLIALVVVLAAVAVIVTLCTRQPEQEITDEGAGVEELGEGVQSVRLAFASRGAGRMIEERREIVVMEDPAGRARRILEELAAGPVEPDADGTIPEGTRVLEVFFDGTGGVFVDFSRELVDNHPGGSTGELYTIRSIVRTLALNFPDIERVKILVDGNEVETIAGHIDASVPFPVEQYR